MELVKQGTRPFWTTCLAIFLVGHAPQLVVPVSFLKVWTVLLGRASIALRLYDFQGGTPSKLL